MAEPGACFLFCSTSLSIVDSSSGRRGQQRGGSPAAAQAAGLAPPAGPSVCWELGAATASRVAYPTPSWLATHCPAALLAAVPRAAVLFGAGALSGAIAKSITAPLDRVRARAGCGCSAGAHRWPARQSARTRPFVDRVTQSGIDSRSPTPLSTPLTPCQPTRAAPALPPPPQVKILLQVKGGMQGGAIAAAASKGNLLQAFLAIGREEGILGYWKGNLPQASGAGAAGAAGLAGPCAGHAGRGRNATRSAAAHAACSRPPHTPRVQVLRVVPYSAAQLYSYEVFKRMFQDEEGGLSVQRRLAAGACAGMAATLVRPGRGMG